MTLALARGIYDYFYDNFDRRSYDGSGDLTVYLDSSAASGNAFYFPNYLEFGNGYAVRDIVAHEFTHGVTDSTSGLIYQNQSGALNESYSDVFGAMVDRDWLHGEDVPGGASRDLSNPPAFGDPDHMNNFVVTTGDNGGVHKNSGIPNKAAYLIAHGGTHPVSGITVRGIGMQKTARLYYDVLTSRLGPSSNFTDARDATVAQVRAHVEHGLGLYGFTEDDISSVMQAFTAVGLGLPDATPAEVRIVTPANGSSYVRRAANIPFMADIRDDESGYDANAVIWRSNRDGEIGRGRSITTNSLSYGDHVVTVTARNGAGLESTATVNVSVINTPPDVQILAPANGATLYAGASVELRASVSDNETLPDSQVYWYANGAYLGFGRTLPATLSAGTVTLIVRAFDSQGADDAASVTVTVRTPTSTPPVITSITVPDRVMIAGFDSAKGMWYADVDLAGTATDAEDGPLTGSRLQWTTNRTDLQSGSLGSGTSRRVRLYSPDMYGARHLITLTATDSSGQSVSVTRELVLWTLI